MLKSGRANRCATRPDVLLPNPWINKQQMKHTHIRNSYRRHVDTHPICFRKTRYCLRANDAAIRLLQDMSAKQTEHRRVLFWAHTKTKIFRFWRREGKRMCSPCSDHPRRYRKRRRKQGNENGKQETRKENKENKKAQIEKPQKNTNETTWTC